MKGFLKKAKSEFRGFLDNESKSPAQHASQTEPQQQPLSGGLKGKEQDRPSVIQEPTALDILRYRYHHGTNLGSVFVLERWLSPSAFPDCPGSSELAAVKSWVEKIGLEETRQKFEARWDSAVSDADIVWLKEKAHCTTIRLPIGYFDLGGSCMSGTPFERYEGVYRSAWDKIRSLITRLRANGIGVLVDLHALPGGANPNEHSGTNSEVAALWTSKSHRKLGIQCCESLARSIKQEALEVCGIQIVNEADWDSPHMYEWYDDCIAAISTIDPTVPIIISDAWNLNRAIEYALKKNTPYPECPSCPVIIDTHYYWAFSDADKAKSPMQICEEVYTKLSELDGKEGSVVDRGAVQVIIGEYSCVLTEDSWAKRGSIEKQDLVRQFGQTQSRQWHHRSGGSFFWTWKMDWYPGGEWGFAAQTENGAIVPPPIYCISDSQRHTILQRTKESQHDRMREAVEQHISYWRNTAPDMQGEHWRYAEGWKRGYADAMAFFEGNIENSVTGPNKIGCLEIWVLKRVRESGFRGGFVWEFEQGLRKGIQDFYALSEG